MTLEDITSSLKFNQDGLIPVIIQQYDSLEVLMMAWMNIDAINQTLSTETLHLFSRSRQKLWVKGESSGQTQILKELIIDCDDDTLLAKVDQKGVACHTGRSNCFFKKIDGDKITINQDVITDPKELYKK